LFPRAMRGVAQAAACLRRVTIRRSHAAEIQRLLDELAASDDARRQAAAARLALLGERATPRLLTVLGSDAPPAVKVAALQALEGIGDPRALPAAAQRARDPQADVAAAAVAVLRSFLPRAESAAALDQLAALALDSTCAPALRALALDTLTDLPERTIAPIFQRLAEDPTAPLVQAARERHSASPTEPAEALARALDPRSETTAAEARSRIAQLGSKTPISALHKLLDVIRVREAAAADVTRRAEWLAARAAVHHELARLGSRVALYDLREMLERADGPLPLDCLAAVVLVGDASCLGALAVAFERGADARGDDWERRRLAAAFRAILQREKPATRRAALKRLRTKAPAVVDAMLAEDAGPAPSLFAGAG